MDFRAGTCFVRVCTQTAANEVYSMPRHRWKELGLVSLGSRVPIGRSTYQTTSDDEDDDNTAGHQGPDSRA
jgi:hypothetical protein